MDEIWPAGLCFAVSFGGENTSFLFGSQKFIIFMGEVTEMEAIWFHDPSSLASLAYIYLKNSLMYENSSLTLQTSAYVSW